MEENFSQALSLTKCIIPLPTLDKSLQKFYSDDSIKIRRVDITTPPLKGENLSSIVEYLDIHYDTDNNSTQKKNVNLFFKRSLPGEMGKALFEEWKVHVKEERFLTELLPIYLEIAKTAQPTVLNPLQPTLDFIPRPIYTNNDQILLENFVKQFNYTMLPPNLTVGHDLPKVESVLKCLAQFHAISFVMKHRSSEPLTEKFNYLNNNLLYPSMKVALGGFISLSVQLLAEFLKNTPEYEEIGEDFAKIAPLLFDAAVQASQLDEYDSELNVICHGDCWNNNILFGPENSIKLVDYQIIRYVPLTCDLLHYLYSCTNPQFRKAYLNHFQQFYYDEFFNCVEQFDPALKHIFSFDTLLESFEKRRLFGLLYSAPFLLNGFINKKDLPDSEEAETTGLLNSMFEMNRNVLKQPDVAPKVLLYMKELHEEMKPNIDRYLNNYISVTPVV